MKSNRLRLSAMLCVGLLVCSSVPVYAQEQHERIHVHDKEADMFVTLGFFTLLCCISYFVNHSQDVSKLY